MAQGGAHAIGAGVAAADDDHVFAVSGDVIAAGLVEHGLGVGGEEIHGKVDAFQIAAGNRQIAGFGGSGADHGGIEFPGQLFRRIVASDGGVADKFHPFILQQGNAAEHDFVFVELHVGNAIHEQTTGPVGPLEDGDAVPGFVQLGGGTETGGTGTNHGHFFAGAF